MTLMSAYWRFVLVAAFTILLASCASADSEPEADGAMSDARPTTGHTESLDLGIVASPSAQVVREGRVYADPSPLMSVQQSAGVAPVLLASGEYTFDALGTELTLTFEQPWRLDLEYPGFFRLAGAEGALLSEEPSISFARPIGLAEPLVAGTNAVGNGPDGWRPGLTVAEWIALMPQVTEQASGDVANGNRIWRWHDVSVDADLGATNPECAPGPCVRFLWTGQHFWSVIRAGVRTRVYEIDDPLGSIVVIVAATDPAEFEHLNRSTERLLTTAKLGPSLPLPIPNLTAHARQFVVPAGQTWAFSGIPGVRLEAAESTAVSQRPGELQVVDFIEVASTDASGSGVGTYSDQFGRLGLVAPIATIDGVPILSQDDIVQALRNSGDSVSAVESTSVLGFEAFQLDIEHHGDGVFLLSPPLDGYDSAQTVWPRVTYIRAWVFTGPMGPMMLAATGQTMEDRLQAERTLSRFLRSITLCDMASNCASG